MTRDSWLALTPHDTFTVRDGRSFDAGAVALARSVASPSPSTVAGAVGAALGGEPSEVRGPVIAVGQPYGGWSLRFPVPADLTSDDDDLRRLRPEPLSVGVQSSMTSAHNSPSRVLSGTGSAVDGWLPESVMQEYLLAEEHPPGRRSARWIPTSPIHHGALRPASD